jgi:V-type H+-transporting ATPase subunit H
MAHREELAQMMRSSSAAEAMANADKLVSLSNYKPPWNTLGLKGNLDALKLLELGDSGKTKAVLLGNLPNIVAVLEACQAPDKTTVQWTLTVLHDVLREDSASYYGIFEEALKANVDVYGKFKAVISSAQGDVYTCKTAAWILTSVMGYLPRFFDDAKVTEIAKLLTANKPQAMATFTEMGVLESMTNLIKSDSIRTTLWKIKDVQSVFLDPISDLKNKESDMCYRIIFAVWLLSLDKGIMQDLKANGVPKKIKEIISSKRVEKIVRISLVTLKSLLTDKQVCEDLVEAGAYDAVSNLEFEKWRDAELYEEIREMGSQIANQVDALSNFDRYERELHSGKLSWGFIHTPKFWGENVMKFEQNDFRAVKTLVALLSSEDNETLAVACHDLGEFVTLHPFGKKQAAKLNFKPRVMELMQMQGDNDKIREVRREALLCCQKIMLNKWQDIEKPKA